MTNGRPTQMTSALDRDDAWTDHAEVVIVGLGAGGGMVFHDLAQAGVDVLGVEMGESVQGIDGQMDVSQIEDQMIPRLFQESGARATDDFGVSILQGKGVGGSTVHNTNLCKRLPEPTLAHWAAEYGLDWATGDQLQEDFAAVEEMLNVHEVPDERVNRNNRVVERGIRELGWAGGRLKHNRHPEDCRQSGYCELGCPNNGKQNAAKVLIPPGLEAGGRVLTEARVERILVEDGRAVGVAGVAADPVGGGERARFEIRADVVCLAGSATGSAALVQQSGLPDPYRLAGTNLHMHPGATVLGLFDEPIESWVGNPQSVECTEFLDPSPGSDRRAWIVAGAAHPAGAATFVPGFGRSHGEMMRQYPNLASLIVMLHDHTSGRVRPGDGEQVHVHYRLGRSDYEQLAAGISGAGETLLAAGAREVVVPITPPLRASSPAGLKTLTAEELGPLNPALAAVHPMSTLWMGDNPKRSVVDPRGAHHHVDGLFVADGSLFPTSFGGPPQIPIYTMGRRVARTIVNRKT